MMWQLFKLNLKSLILCRRGWLIALIFAGLFGVFFQSLALTYLDMQRQSLATTGAVVAADQLLRALGHNVYFLFLLLVPAVTMVIAPQLDHQGAGKIYACSPIKLWQLVLLKVMAASIFMLFLVALSAVYFTAVVWWSDMSWSRAIMMVCGLSLLGFSQVCLGVWASSMTKHAGVSYILCLAVLLGFFILEWAAPYLTVEPSWVAFLEGLATQPHLETFLSGLLDLHDIAYFVFLSIVFYLCALFHLQQKWGS